MGSRSGVRAASLAVAVVALSVAAAPAIAQAGPPSQSLTCESARRIVASRGAAVLTTGRNAYDRYVSSSQFCVLGETTEPAWIPTADTPQCLVGYRCRETDLEVFGR